MFSKKTPIDNGMVVFNNGEELPDFGVSLYASGTLIVLKQGDHNVTISLQALSSVMNHFKDIIEGNVK